MAGTSQVSQSFKDLVALCESPEQEERPTFGTLAKSSIWTRCRGMSNSVISVLITCGAKLDRLREDITLERGSYAGRTLFTNEEADVWNNWSFVQNDEEDDDNNKGD
eukprot:TRINITY_DN1319_c0_g1_i1.p1 TRINITY_DN1319_c0_g1~~TRINITY_DN1319_c0_g1_i1.p1  ORF type:complete len:107 (-),score=20.71 TRINITY_DN1319_c0_g1_i1:44-364(-)